MRLSPISSLLLILPLICASSLLTFGKESAPAQNRIECSAFSRDNYVLTESNCSYFGFVMTNSTLSIDCDLSTFLFNKYFLGKKEDYSLYYTDFQVNETYSKSFEKLAYKLTKEQEQQIQAFKKVIRGANNGMILYYDKGRLATKWLGLGEFESSRTDDRLKLNFTISTKNGTKNETAMAVLKDYQDKRFIVERVAGPVDCKSSEVKGLKVAECNGNIQIKNLPVAASPTQNPNRTECSVFSSDSYILTESDVGRVGFVITNSTLSFKCDYSSSTSKRSWLGKKKEYSVYYNHSNVNETYSKLFFGIEHKLNEKQKQQMKSFISTVNGTDNWMILRFDKGRLATEWFGLGEFLAFRTKDHFKLSFSIATNNGTKNETAMALLKNYEDKRFIVERVAGPVNCTSSEVKGLKVAECEGNIQIKNFPT